MPSVDEIEVEQERIAPFLREMDLYLAIDVRVVQVDVPLAIFADHGRKPGFEMARLQVRRAGLGYGALLGTQNPDRMPLVWEAEVGFPILVKYLRALRRQIALGIPPESWTVGIAHDVSVTVDGSAIEIPPVGLKSGLTPRQEQGRG